MICVFLVSFLVSVKEFYDALFYNWLCYDDTQCMVPTGSDESKLRTFQGPSQDQISGYKDFHGEFHNADI